MADSETPLPAPKNQLVEVVNAILDSLILGLGEEVAFSAAVSAVPWLAAPVISWILKQAISYLAQGLDTNLKKGLDVLIIRFQGDVRKASYDEAVAKFKQVHADPTRSAAEKAQALQDARSNIDRIGHWGT